MSAATIDEVLAALRGMVEAVDRATQAELAAVPQERLDKAGVTREQLAVLNRRSEEPELIEARRILALSDGSAERPPSGKH